MILRTMSLRIIILLSFVLWGLGGTSEASMLKNVGYAAVADGSFLEVTIAVKAFGVTRSAGVHYHINEGNWMDLPAELYSPQGDRRTEVEVYKAQIPVSHGDRVEYVVFCSIDGQVYWDNNDTQNYVTLIGYVHLVSAISTFQMHYGGYLDRVYTMKVYNTGISRLVTVNQITTTGDWIEVEASYEKPAETGWEIWKAEIHQAYADHISGDFYIDYMIDGVIYEDTNNGEYYSLAHDAGPMFGRNINVLLWYPPSYSTGLGHINVRNLAYDKIVTVVYTFDGWATTLYTNGWFVSNYTWGYAYVHSPNEHGIERWDFSITGGSLPLEFAISYTVNGATYWDNNFTHNYYIDTPKVANETKRVSIK